MLNFLFVVISYFSQGVYFDNLLGGDFMAQGFIHSESAPSSAYDNPALLGLLEDIYVVFTESPRNNRTFYVETKGRSKSPLWGIISPKFAMYYRKIYSLNERVESPLYVDKERYSEYTMGLASSNKSISIGVNFKYLTATYAFLNSDSTSTFALDFARGFTQDVGLCLKSSFFTLTGAYDNLYGILWWESKKKDKLPSRFFLTLGIYPLKKILGINAEYEKNYAFSNNVFKGSFSVNIPYEIKKWNVSVKGGYIFDKNNSLLTYGFEFKKSDVSVALGFDNKGNLAVSIYTKGSSK